MRYYLRGVWNGSSSPMFGISTVYNLLFSPEDIEDPVEVFMCDSRSLLLRDYYGDTEGLYSTESYILDGCILTNESLRKDLEYNKVSVLLFQTKWEF